MFQFPRTQCFDPRARKQGLCLACSSRDFPQPAPAARGPRRQTQRERPQERTPTLRPRLLQPEGRVPPRLRLPGALTAQGASGAQGPEVQRMEDRENETNQETPPPLLSARSPPSAPPPSAPPPPHRPLHTHTRASSALCLRTAGSRLGFRLCCIPAGWF